MLRGCRYLFHLQRAFVNMSSFKTWQAGWPPPHLQRRLRIGEVKQLAQNCTANSWQNQALNPRLLSQNEASGCSPYQVASPAFTGLPCIRVGRWWLCLIPHPTQVSVSAQHQIVHKAFKWQTWMRCGSCPQTHSWSDFWTCKFSPYIAEFFVVAILPCPQF